MASNRVNVEEILYNSVKDNVQYIGGDNNILEIILKDLSQIRRDIRDIKSRQTD